jgi:hypothetical protein
LLHWSAKPRVGSLELLDTHRAEGFRMRRFVAEAAPEASRQKSWQLKKDQPSLLFACSVRLLRDQRDFGEW